MKAALVILSMLLSTQAFATVGDYPCEREVVAAGLANIVNGTTLNALYEDAFSVVNVSPSQLTDTYDVTVDAKSSTDNSITENIVSVQIKDAKKCVVSAKLKAG